MAFSACSEYRRCWYFTVEKVLSILRQLPPSSYLLLDLAATGALRISVDVFMTRLTCPRHA